MQSLVVDLHNDKNNFIDMNFDINYIITNNVLKEDDRDRFIPIMHNYTILLITIIKNINDLSVISHISQYEDLLKNHDYIEYFIIKFEIYYNNILVLFIWFKQINI